MRTAEQDSPYGEAPTLGNDAYGCCPGVFPILRRQISWQTCCPSINLSSNSPNRQLEITGMDCPVCSGVIQRKLLETPGVVKAEVRYPAGSATVQFDSVKTDTSKLIAVVNDTGYKAAVANSAQE
jgi:copper chaperone CopZ